MLNKNKSNTKSCEVTHCYSVFMMRWEEKKNWKRKGKKIERWLVQHIESDKSDG